jgi:hypothetical protein
MAGIFRSAQIDWQVVSMDCKEGYSCDQLKLKFVINLLALIDLLRLIYESKF